MRQFASIEQQVNSLLAGSFYASFSAGDTWTFNFGDICLVGQDVLFSEGAAVHQTLQTALPHVLGGVDPEYAATSLLAARYLRHPVLNVRIADDASLTLDFGQASLSFPSTTPTVDWQWAINRSGHDPYTDYLIACFGENELQSDLE